MNKLYFRIKLKSLLSILIHPVIFLFILLLTSFTTFNGDSPVSAFYTLTSYNQNNLINNHKAFNSDDFRYRIPSEYQAGILNQLFFKSFYQAEKEKQYQQALLYYSKPRGTSLIYASPEDAGLSSQRLAIIDSIIHYAIIRGAMPGAQVFVAKNGMIVYEKSFGHHDYSEKQPVMLSDLYDIASITKIAATTLAAMKLVQDKTLDLNAPLGNYFIDKHIRNPRKTRDTLFTTKSINIAQKSQEEIKSLTDGCSHQYLNDTVISIQNYVVQRENETNIFNVPVARLLSHQSGINPSLPIGPYYYFAETYHRIADRDPKRSLAHSEDLVKYNEANLQGGADILMLDIDGVDKTRDDIRHLLFPREEAFEYFFSKTKVKGFADTPITENMFLKNQFKDSIYQAVKRIRVQRTDSIQYSCINMILLQMVIDSINQVDLDTYIKREFYEKLGMKNTTYNPLNHFPKERIVPTTFDEIWRNQLLHGTVHDPSAAVLGGIAGNAGLFSTASDLGILGQMLLNGGIYDEKEYLSKDIIAQFTSSQKNNYRGLGFDKAREKGVHAMAAPASTYGHIGYTGTAMWIDPENEIVFVFLSNRTSPDDSNNLLSKSIVRERVHQAVYNAILPKGNL